MFFVEDLIAETVRLLSDNDQRGRPKHLKFGLGWFGGKARNESFLVDDCCTLPRDEVRSH